MRTNQINQTKSNKSENADPLFFSIQHFCLQDGPGIRSIIFFKGCPLRCLWCHNPESWSKSSQLAYKKHLCIGCKKCVDACPESIITEPGKWDLKKCTKCYKCVDACPSEAMIYFGYSKSIDSILEELKPEYTYYKNSNGGVTFSGGEATLFSSFASKITKKLRDDNIHVALETCGQFKLEGIQSIDEESSVNIEKLKGHVWEFISQLNLILFDVKIFDNEESKKFIGVGNDLIKRNLNFLANLMKNNTGPKLWPRLPLIPKMTDSKKNLTRWAQFLLNAGISHISVIPYHNLGESKKTWIGIDMKNDIPDLSEDDIESAKNILKSEGMTCYTPGEEDW